MEEQLSSDGHLNFNHQESVRTYRECLAWARLLFAENSSLKILRHLFLPWSGHSWSSAVLNCAAVSGREGTSVPALARLLLVHRQRCQPSNGSWNNNLWSSSPSPAMLVPTAHKLRAPAARNPNWQLLVQKMISMRITS